jgi:cytoskeletal protein CcmA (bactofilin family)
MLFGRKLASRHGPSPAPTATQERAPGPPGDGHIVGAVDDTPIQSFVDASLTIVGDLHSAGDVRIDGRICGNVRCAQLIVGRSAAITGAVIAEQAIVRGRITGTIRSPVVVIQDTAHVESEITYGLLAIDDGAFFEGAAHRRDNPLEQEPALPLAELQQVAQAAAGAPVAQAAAAETEAPARPTLLGPPEAPGKAPMTNGHAPMANGHTPTG